MFLNKFISKKNINTATGTANPANITIVGKKFELPYVTKPIRVGIYAIIKNINILKYTQALASLGLISLTFGVVFLV